MAGIKRRLHGPWVAWVRALTCHILYQLQIGKNGEIPLLLVHVPMPTFHFLKYFTRRKNYFCLSQIVHLEIKILMTTSLCATYFHNTMTFSVLRLQYRYQFKFVFYITSPPESNIISCTHRDIFYNTSPVGYLQYCCRGTYMSRQLEMSSWLTFQKLYFEFPHLDVWILLHLTCRSP